MNNGKQPARPANGHYKQMQQPALQVAAAIRPTLATVEAAGNQQPDTIVPAPCQSYDFAGQNQPSFDAASEQQPVFERQNAFIQSAPSSGTELLEPRALEFDAYDMAPAIPINGALPVGSANDCGFDYSDADVLESVGGDIFRKFQRCKGIESAVYTVKIPGSDRSDVRVRLYQLRWRLEKQNKIGSGKNARVIYKPLCYGQTSVVDPDKPIASDRVSGLWLPNQAKN